MPSAEESPICHLRTPPTVHLSIMKGTYSICNWVAVTHETYTLQSMLHTPGKYEMIHVVTVPQPHLVKDVWDFFVQVKEELFTDDVLYSLKRGSVC